jgi:anti-anti-sigma factor
VQRPHVVTFNGELDIWKERDVESSFSAVDGSVPVIVDLAGVRYLDSAFLSALVRLRRRLPACSITLVVETPSVRRILELTDMHRLFEIVRSRPPT